MDEDSRKFYSYNDTLCLMRENQTDAWMSYWWWLHNNKDGIAINAIRRSLNQEELPQPRFTHDEPIRIKTMYADNKNLRIAVLNYIKMEKKKNEQPIASIIKR